MLNFTHLILVFFNSASAQEPIELGQCQVRKVKPEAHVRQLAEKAGLSNVEVLARLIYSESLSTGYWKNRCSAPSTKELMTSIGWGIMNRVHLHPNKTQAYYETIFKKSQFSTSFSSKKKQVNIFAQSYLCPNRAREYLGSKESPQKLYQQTIKLSAAIIAQYEREGIPGTYQGITNFFYPKSEYFGELRPRWAPQENPVKNNGYLNLWKSPNPCVEFYKL